jgi:hypothetical protein
VMILTMAAYGTVIACCETLVTMFREAKEMLTRRALHLQLANSADPSAPLPRHWRNRLDPSTQFPTSSHALTNIALVSVHPLARNHSHPANVSGYSSVFEAYCQWKVPRCWECMEIRSMITMPFATQRAVLLISSH